MPWYKVEVKVGPQRTKFTAYTYAEGLHKAKMPNYLLKDTLFERAFPNDLYDWKDLDCIIQVTKLKRLPKKVKDAKIKEYKQKIVDAAHMLTKLIPNAMIYWDQVNNP